MSIFEWCVIAALMFGLLIFCARIMRRGLTSLDDDRRKRMEQIAEGQRLIDEDKKNISAADQLYLAEAAMRDLLRLDCLAETCRIEAAGHRIELHGPDADWQVELLMRERSLRSRRKILHGQSRWLLQGPQIWEEHRDLAALMASLVCHLRGGAGEEKLPVHLARRIAANRSRQRRLK